MKLGDLLETQELFELGNVAPSTQSAPNNGQNSQGTAPAPGSHPTTAGQQPAVANQFNANGQAQQAAASQQDKTKQRANIQNQINALNKQIADLRTQLSNIK